MCFKRTKLYEVSVCLFSTHKLRSPSRDFFFWSRSFCSRGDRTIHINNFLGHIPNCNDIPTKVVVDVVVLNDDPQQKKVIYIFLAWRDQRNCLVMIFCLFSFEIKINANKVVELLSKVKYFSLSFAFSNFLPI